MAARHRVKLARLLVDWYRKGHRDLPWRRTSDPYRIWVSEIMLQQTRAQAATPYYQRFLERFPTAGALAAASEDEVLALWSGLGYYSRARNLRRAAQQVADADGFPREYEAIRALAGVGDYTAAAIASIAFGLPRAVVDGNVMRVVARLQARHHAHHIAIHHRTRQAESDARDGRGGVIAHACERADGLIFARKPVRVRYLLGRAPQVASARVISQAAPQRQHFIFGGRRQGPRGGKALQEALVVRDGRLRPGLLQHDLRNPDAVGVRSAPPRQIAMAFPVPVDEQAGELHSMTRSHSATTAKSRGSTSQASYSGLSGSRRIRSCCHWSSPL